MVALSIDRPLRQSDILLAGPLVKVRFLNGFKPSRRLEHHLADRADRLKIETIGDDPVHADISHHQHAQLAVPFRLGPHQPGQQLDLFAVCPHHGHPHHPETILCGAKMKKNRDSPRFPPGNAMEYFIYFQRIFV
jgi:hypothetical protein